MSLVDILLSRSQCVDKGITFIESSAVEDFLSYQDFYQAALSALGLIQHRGVSKGSEVVIQVDDNRTFLQIFWGCVLGGMVPVPLSVGKNKDHKQKLSRVWEQLNAPYIFIDRSSQVDVMQQITSSGVCYDDHPLSARILFVDEISKDVYLPVIHKAREEDIAFIQFSSGSTGSPKGVVLTHANLLANLEGISVGAGYTANDIMLSWMPLTHDMGMIGFHLSPLLCGASQYIIPTTTFVRNPNIWIDKVSQHRVTVTCSPNFGYRYLLKYINETGKAWDLSCVRIIYNGAEPISDSVCHEFTHRLSSHGLRSAAICPVYGLAEASVAVTMSSPTAPFESVCVKRTCTKIGDVMHHSAAGDDTLKFINVGRPIRHCAVAIRDARHRKVDDGVVGYIWISGRNVTKGYYNNVDASAAVIDADGWLDTGDIGFFHNDDLYVTGRAKDIIFVNGQNFYSHDLELAAQQMAGIELNKIAITAYFDQGDGRDEVIAFIFHRGAINSKLIDTVRELQACISTKFGVSVSRVIPVNDIPRTTSGKLQRFALLDRFLNGHFDQQEQQFQAAFLAESPVNEKLPTAVETILIARWNEILLRKDITPTSKFFCNGGDSLKAIELLSHIERQFGVHVLVSSFFEDDSISALAAQITGGHSEQASRQHSERRSNRISALQKRIYYAWKLSPQSTAYNLPIVLKLSGSVDQERIARALREIVHVHSSLRMYFTEVEDVNFIFCENFAVNIEPILCKRTDVDRSIRALIQPFDLWSPPLFRFKLLFTSDTQEHFLFLDAHHIIMDGISMQRIIGNLLAVYHDDMLENASINYTDYVGWEEDQLPSLWPQHKAFWIEHLNTSVPVIDLPLDNYREAVSRNNGERLVFDFDNTIQQLDEFLTQTDVSRQSVLLATYTLLLSHYSGQHDFVVGIPAQVQIPDHLTKLCGMFTNSIPFRVKFDQEETTINYIKRTHRLVAKYLDHRGLPLDELLKQLGIRGSFGRSPLFDTMFLYQGNMTSTWKGEKLVMERHTFDPGFSKFDLTLEVFTETGRMRYAFEYSTDLFARETITGMAKSYIQLLSQILQHAHQPLRTLHISQDEAIVKPLNDGLRSSNFESIVEQFEHQVLKTPQNMAILYGDTHLTFEQLDKLRCQFINAFHERGVNKADIIALDMARSPELVAVILACLSIGAIYLPLDSEVPAQRKEFIIQDSGCRWLVINKELTIVNSIQPQILDVRPLLVEGKSSSASFAQNNTIVADDIAYVIYTSGTTGSPKGTLISHGSLSNYVTWAARTYLETDSCFAFYSSISFDLTVTSFFCPLVHGSKMVIYKESQGTLSIEAVLHDNIANVIKLTPSHLRLLLTNKRLKHSTMKKTFIVGGEAFETNLARQVWEDLAKNVDIYNEYGPTEATVGCMIYLFTPEDKTKTVPIGVPIDHIDIYILNEFLHPVPSGVLGEIYIAGAGLAQGYLQRSELTSEKFITNPFVPGHSMYKTGDLARRLFNGTIEYHGRTDHQVKIHGHRVELHEVEAVIKTMPSLTEAVVLLQAGSPPSLIAYYVASDISADDIRHWLLDRLPYYMIPAQCISVDHVPLTHNGKVDTSKLRGLATPVRNEVAAKSEIEDVLLNVWKRILHLDEISPMDNFFAIGGDSIKALQIASSLFAENLSIDVKDILGLQTIRNISRNVQRVDALAIAQGTADDVEGTFQPNPIQSWFLSREYKNPDWYHQSLLLHAPEDLDAVVLRNVVHALIQQHDSLRVNLTKDGRTLFYDQLPAAEDINVPTFCISSREALPGICNQIRQSFKLAKTLLIRFALIRVENDEVFLFIAAHHLIIDGVSWRILLDDLTRVYAALRNKTQFEFPIKSMSMKAWNQELVKFTSSTAFVKDLAYWDFLKDTPFTLPCDSGTGHRGVRKLRRDFNQRDTQLLSESNKPYRSDISILLNAALVRALGEWTGHQSVLIEQESHGRLLDSFDASRSIGWFTSMYPVAFACKTNWKELIQEVKERLRTVPRNGIAFGANQFLKRQGKDDQAYNTDIRLNYIGHFRTPDDQPVFSLSNLSIGEETDPDNQMTAKIEINAMIYQDVFQAHIAYDAALFLDITIGNLVDHWIQNIHEIIQHAHAIDDIYFTPSDFNAVSLKQDDLDLLFENEIHAR